jgi:hypothetical protein
VVAVAQDNQTLMVLVEGEEEVIQMEAMGYLVQEVMVVVVFQVRLVEVLYFMVLEEEEQTEIKHPEMLVSLEHQIQEMVLVAVGQHQVLTMMVPKVVLELLF